MLQTRRGQYLRERTTTMYDEYKMKAFPNFLYLNGYPTYLRFSNGYNQTMLKSMNFWQELTPNVPNRNDKLQHEKNMR